MINSCVVERRTTDAAQSRSNSTVGPTVLYGDLKDASLHSLARSTVGTTPCLPRLNDQESAFDGPPQHCINNNNNIHSKRKRQYVMLCKSVAKEKNTNLLSPRPFKNEKEETKV